MAVGHESDPTGTDQSREVVRQWKVGVGDHEVVSAVGTRGIAARRDGGVETGHVAAHNLRADGTGPRCHRIVVAHDIHGEGRCGGHDGGGAVARELFAVVLGERSGESTLGEREGLHRDDDCGGHGVSLRTPTLGPPSVDRIVLAYCGAMATIRMAVVGGGSWGTTVASLAAANAPTTLWARRESVVESINTAHVNPDFLGDRPLSTQLRASASLEETVSGADVVVMAVPSQGFRQVMRDAAPFIRPWVPIVSLSKGLEADTMLRMSQVANEEMPGHPVAVLTGPNLASEIAAGQPAAAVVAIDDAVIATALQGIFGGPLFRVYTNSDVVGCEIAGVVKNVIAIAAGIIEGMGFGDNTKATLITRGLAEMTRLAIALGADPMSLAGLAGVGDLIATCSSRSSRNMSVGMRLGQGEAIADIVSSTKMVAEGVRSSKAVLQLAQAHQVDMPIVEQVVAVCHHGASVSDSLVALMSRRSKSELH